MLCWTALASCQDPPDPPPVPGPPDLPRWSTAPYVAWAGVAEAGRAARPLAVFVDSPGGPLDAIAADADVTTFLNDRFTPVFLRPDAAPWLAPDGPTALFLDAAGCALDAPGAPETPAAWVSRANAVLLAAATGAPAPRPLPARGPDEGTLALPEGHPLSARCGTAPAKPALTGPSE